MNYTVSVVMITYGHEKYIGEAINGVFMQQTDFPVELIIANDCSPDQTDEVIKSFLNKVPDNITVNYACHMKNMGMQANFIWACGKATGKYIALCEGDDYWTDPLKLQKQVDFLEDNPDFTFSMGRVNMLIEKTGEIRKRKERVNPQVNEMYSLKDYISAPFSQTSSFLFRHDGVPFPEWFHHVHAGDQSLVIIKTGIYGKIKYHNDVFSFYRMNQASVTNTKSAKKIFKQFDETLNYWDAFLNYMYEEQVMVRKFQNMLNWRYVALSKSWQRIPLRIFLYFLNLFRI